jgi:hypothetical protein
MRIRRVTLTVPGLAPERAPQLARLLAAELSKGPQPSRSRGHVRVGPLSAAQLRDEAALARDLAHATARELKGGPQC